MAEKAKPEKLGRIRHFAKEAHTFGRGRWHAVGELERAVMLAAVTEEILEADIVPAEHHAVFTRLLERGGEREALAYVNRYSAMLIRAAREG